MTLSEAGNYVGPDAIEEYAKFATSLSPYFKSNIRIAVKIEPAGYSPSNGTCDFLLHFVVEYQTDPTIAVPFKANVVLSLKITYDAARNKIPRINVFFSKQYLATVFSAFRTKSDEFICQTLSNKCTSTYNLNNIVSLKDCLRRLWKIPVSSRNGYIDGFDYGCRVLHGTFAAQNPFHCNHLSFIPAQDPSGAIKCQNSSQIPISDLFNTTY